MPLQRGTFFFPRFSSINFRRFSTADGPPTSPAPPERRVAPPLSPMRTWARRAGWVASGVWLLLGKTKYLLAGLKLAKFSTLISLGLSVGAYTLVLGLPFAVGLVGQIFLHESGHALMMRHLGIPFSPMVFIPFMGAVVGMKEPAKNGEDEAYVALAGPVAGLFAAVGLSGIGILAESDLCIALAHVGFIINLFNMLPIATMDGGRVAAVLSKWISLGGLGIGGALIWYGVVANPLFYLILFMGVISTAGRFFGKSPVNPDYYKLSNVTKVKLIGAYAAIVAALLAGMAVNDQFRKTPQEMREARGKPKSDLEDSFKIENVEARVSGFLKRINPFPQTEQLSGTVVVSDMSTESLQFERALKRECPDARVLSGSELDELAELRKWDPERYRYLLVPAECKEVTMRLIEERKNAVKRKL